MRKSSVLALAAYVVAATPVHAGDAASGNLYNVQSNYVTGSALLFYTDGARTNVPSCASANPNRFAVTASTPGGQAMIAILTAVSVGRKSLLTALEIARFGPMQRPPF